MGLCQQEKQTGNRGGIREEEDSNTISKNRLYLHQLCLIGLLRRDPEDSGFQRVPANCSWCQKSFIKSYLYPFDHHTAVLCRQSLNVQAARYGCLRKCILAWLQKQHRRFRIHPNMFLNLLRPTHSWVEVCPG